MKETQKERERVKVRERVRKRKIFIPSFASLPKCSSLARKSQRLRTKSKSPKGRVGTPIEGVITVALENDRNLGSGDGGRN